MPHSRDDGPADTLSELLAAHCQALQGWLHAGADGRAPALDAALAAWRAAHPDTSDAFERTLAQGLRFVGLIEDVLRLGAAPTAGVHDTADWQRLIDTLQTLPFGGGADTGLQTTWRALAKQLPAAWAALLPWLQPGGDAAGITAELHRGLPLPGIAPAGLQDDWAALAAAWKEYLDAETAYRALLDAAAHEAGERLRAAVRREAPASVRALYDRWIAESETVWAKQLQTERYADTQTRLIHALLHCRRAQQRLVASLAGQLDLPTRAEIDTLELRLHETRSQQRQFVRELAALRSELATLRGTSAP